jgi:plasmid stability protein
MATLHVRSVPEDLYERLQKLAQTQNRSLSAQVITLLHQALQEEENRKRQGKLLADIRRRRFVLPAGAADSVELLREDRRR